MKLNKTMIRAIEAFIKGLGEIRSMPIISMLRKLFTLTNEMAARVFKAWLLQADAWAEFNRCKYSTTFQRI